MEKRRIESAPAGFCLTMGMCLQTPRILEKDVSPRTSRQWRGVMLSSPRKPASRTFEPVYHRYAPRRKIGHTQGFFLPCCIFPPFLLYIVVMKDLGTILIIFGVVLLAIGILLSLTGSIPWLGRLPGDIRIQRPGFSFYFPITTGILISIVLSLILYLFRFLR